MPATDPMWEDAAAWLWSRRRTAPVNADVWDLRWRWLMRGEAGKQGSLPHRKSRSLPTVADADMRTGKKRESHVVRHGRPGTEVGGAAGGEASSPP